MNYTKSDLIKKIEEAKGGVKMGAAILDTVKKFEHRKVVDKRFTDALKELGYYAYIQKDNFSSTLVCSWTSRADSWGRSVDLKNEFRHYISHCFGKVPFTWGGIKEELARYNFEDRLVELEGCFVNFDKELAEFEEFVAYIESKKFTCFDSHKTLWDMQCTLREAKKDLAREVAQ